ncbi:MAG: phosphatase PAP2 family protein [Ilumatobacteraceae bacterium]
MSTPGHVSRLDGAADIALEPLRNNRATVAVFGAASRVGDFSVVWHALGLLRAVGSLERLREAVFLSCALGVESLVVNQGVKRMFRRERPTVSGDGRFDVRTPSTSSFPSGHASSATFAVIVLAGFAGWPVSWLFAVVGATVALSRVVVRIHHMSDVVGGIVVGALLGAVARAAAGAVLG